jgi:hypothetical protein
MEVKAYLGLGLTMPPWERVTLRGKGVLKDA